MVMMVVCLVGRLGDLLGKGTIRLLGGKGLAPFWGGSHHTSPPRISSKKDLFVLSSEKYFDASFGEFLGSHSTQEAKGVIYLKTII